MNQKTTIIVYVFIVTIICGVVTTFASFTAKNEINANLVTQYANNELSIGQELSKSLKTGVERVLEKLYFISQIAEVKHPTNPEACNQQLIKSYAQFQSELIGNIVRVGLDDTLKCSLNKSIIGDQASTLDTYISDIFSDPGHKPVISRIIKSATGKGYAIAIHIPIFDEQQGFNGTLGAAIYLDKLQEMYLQGVNISKNGYVTLTDDDTVILNSVKREFIGQSFLDNAYQAATGYNQELNQRLDLALKGKVSNYTYSLSGEQRLATFYPVDIFPGRKWVLTIVIPVSDIQVSLNSVGLDRIFFTQYGITILLIAFTPLLLLWYLIRTILNPVTLISKSVKQIRDGDMSVRIPFAAGRRDEIHELTLSFNSMASKLDEVHGDLEDKVTERTTDLEIEKNKSESQRKFLETLIENLPVGVYVGSSPDGNPIMVNQVGTEILGYAPKVSVLLTGYPDKYIIENEEGQIYSIDDLPLSFTLRTGEPITRNLVIVKPGQPKMTIRTNSVPIRNGKGELDSVLLVYQDITKEREVDRAKTEFVSLASHQLRTPLTAIKWYTETLLDSSSLNNDQTEAVNEIFTGSQRMITLVNALLNVSRIDLGTVAVEPEPTKVNDVVDSILKEVEGEIDRKKIQLTKQYQIPTPILNLDPNLFRIVIQNLVTNAIKYTPSKGKIDVSIGIDQESLNLSITDTGYGIPLHQQHKVFTKLFRADNVLNKDTDGTGLGLYIIKSIMEVCGGKVWFKSIENQGTTFSITLPLAGMSKKDGSRGLT